jgi:hypothetical protein
MTTLSAPFTSARPLGAVVLAFAAAVAGYALRYSFIEPEALGAACFGGGPWWCAPRTALILATEQNGFGWLSLLLAIAAVVWSRWTNPAAHAAVVIGGAGLILYNASMSAIAVVIAVLCLSARAKAAAQPA